MFKLESYITPVILSYVEKYVKNFKPEQSQVSLWGGDASFQNLDLRLEVLEEQLNLPFNFVSGHIHELLIHVPWVKINSEPIIITINTIECVLKLKDERTNENHVPTQKRRRKEILQEQSPPGYIKSMITRVINNITINCNNLILKYVEEDIVLSINVRFLSMQTANHKWEPVFTDIGSYEVMLRKIITIQDLTLCLDKMDTSGIIEVYQDPVLYRCSMMIRLIMNYHSNTAKRASITRMDLHCEKMEFSITEQQIPMLLRLLALVLALQSKQFPSSKEKIAFEEDSETTVSDEVIQAPGALSDVVGWGGWAWNTVSSFLPVDWDSEWSSEQQIAYTGHTIHLGLFVDDATITFKIMETVKEQMFYKTRKIRYQSYQSFLSLRFTGVLIDTLLQGISMTSFQVGCGSIKLYPRGPCSCGHHEVVDGVQSPLYIDAGNLKTNHLRDTLFDNDAVENQGKKRAYKQSVAHHVATHTVEKLLEKCPAFFMDYVHFINLPDNVTSEKLSEFGPSLEYSNLVEERKIRYICGDITIRLCSGIFHRLDLIKQAASKYNYNPYIVIKPDPTIDDLPPVTVEEYEALRENVPIMEIELIMMKGVIELQLSDHQNVSLPRQRKSFENRTEPLTPTFSDDPFVTIEWENIFGSLYQPLYPFRVAACASKQVDLSLEMLQRCYRVIELKVDGLSSQLHLKKHCRTSIIMPCLFNLNYKSLLYPQYWKSLEVIHMSLSWHMDSFTITGTKAKILVVVSIVYSILDPADLTNLLLCSSLFNDACDELNPIYLELCLENINYRNVTSLATVSNKININSVKIFAHNKAQQAFILSGPEVIDQSATKNDALLTMVMQFSKNNNVHVHPPLLSFYVAHMTGCLDPLLLQWLEYKAICSTSKSAPQVKLESHKHVSEGTVSESGSKRRTFRSLHESVHSSSDKEKKKIQESISIDKSKIDTKSDDDAKHAFVTENVKQESKGFLLRLMESYLLWNGLILNGYVDRIIIYIPSMTMSGIGANGIEEAKNQALIENQHLQIFVLKMPSFLVHSVSIHSETLLPYLNKLPVVLPKSIWTQQAHSFPWTFNIIDFQCYTIKGKVQKNCVKNVSFNITVDFATKKDNEPEENKLSSVNLCVYVDTSPISISISEEQVVFLSNIFCNLMNAINNLSLPKKNYTVTSQTTYDVRDVLLPVPPASPTPTQLYLEEATTVSTISTVKDNLGQEQDDLSLTACVQWTIEKIAINLYVSEDQKQPTSKLVLELEDIITSIDVHQVYLKVKHKISTAAIFYYTRSLQSQHWDFGEYTDGLLLCGREDNLEKGEDSGFLTLILTIAKSRNVYTRWGTSKPQKTHKKHLKIDTIPSSEKYIAEIVIKIQTLDIILPLIVMRKYIKFLDPILRFKNSVDKFSDSTIEYFVIPPLIEITNLNNDSLPLIYLEFKGFRLMLPVSPNDYQNFQHDLLMLQLDGISISPQAENPICRKPLRNDIYQLAAQANILSIPGSAVEDRQYQINVNGVCAYTTTWKNYQQSIRKRMSQSYLYTMNENPAVEWNKLENKSALETHFSTFYIITRFDVCVIIAPTILFKPDTVVCSAAAEINCLTDIEATVNLDQIRLIASLYKEIQHLFAECNKDVERLVSEIIYDSKPTVKYKQITPIEELDFDLAKDSGVDFEMSSMNSTTVEKPISQTISEFPPYEFLINCGKIIFMLYEVKQTDKISELNGSELELEENGNKRQPLLYAMINQPNLYISQQQLSQKMQLSCFDVKFALGNEKDDSVLIPNKDDFKVLLIETKCGEPHPDTGIPPSFVVIKCEIMIGKNPQFVVNFGRPTKIYFSLTRLNELHSIKHKVLDCFSYKYVTEKDSLRRSSETNASPEKLNKQRFSAPDLHLTTSQFVLSFTSISGVELILSFASLTENILRLSKPDRICINLVLDSLVISVVNEENIKVLLNPWCCNVTIILLWESWKDLDSYPQVQIQADSDSVYIDIGPKHIEVIKTLLLEYQDFFERMSISSADNIDSENHNTPMADQHYKDDLKSGVFQFVDGSTEDLPYPYQVIFLSYPQQAMAWRYPQPRTLTRIHVSPVPFEARNPDSTAENKIPCIIEYWSESQMSYQRYVDFYLSETDSYRLDLPDKMPTQATSCTWRIVLAPSGPPTAKMLVATRALVACLRIDSYFNTAIIPNVQAALSIGTIHIRLYNHIESDAYQKLPAPLDEYMLHGMIPEVQCFLCLQYKGASFVFNKWTDGSTLFDIGGTMSLHILDYGLLILQEVLDSVDKRLHFSIAEKLDFSLTAKSFSLKFSPAVSHTLAVSTHLWNAALGGTNKNVILTRYVIANDSNIPIRFGQSCTDDNILLHSRQCYFYSWRHMNNQTLRISIEDSAWAWSRPFSVNKEGMQYIEFGNTSKIDIIVEVTSLSATQKLIKFSGQFIIANMLAESFEMKLVKYLMNNAGRQSTVSKDSYFINGQSRPPSIVLDDYTSTAMRLRYSITSNISWTGDIPLQTNAKSSQPWLVKVPLQERGQFISIWVRMITESVNGKAKILAVLSPLYMIQSHLPVPVKVQIDTPSLKASLSRTVNGRGERQQLYCPGTFEHFHQLTFQLETGVSASNPYVPLSYSSVDQRKFFKRPDKENIQSILKELETVHDVTNWPFQNDDNCFWIASEQPQTHVQVQYRDAGLASSTLLLELQPWCFILNSLGCHISVVLNDIELCQIPHYGIVTPPKLDGTFHLGIGIGDTYYTSCALQLAKPDWSQSFYMPRVKGLIPVTGNVKISVDCGSSVCLLNIASTMQEDMRLIRVTSNFVIGNLTKQELCVATLAVPETSANLQFPNDFTFQNINISPSEDPKLGTPIVQWYTIYGPVLDAAAFYIFLSLGHRWSCPVRVDKSIIRRCISIPNGYSTVPVTVTTQEDKNTTYIMIHPDPHPQLFIENACTFKILVGQKDENGENILQDSPHFSWICEVESGGTCHYSIPNVSGRLPDAPFSYTPSYILLSAISSDDNDTIRTVDKNQLNWSRPITLTSSMNEVSDQFVRMPYHGDVKLTMHTRCYTTKINISPISQAEVSVRDIKSKLERKTVGALNTDDDDCFPENAVEKQYFNVQSSGSSTSATTFFSAQDDSSGITSSIMSTPRLIQIDTRLKTTNVQYSCDHFKEIEETNEIIDTKEKSVVLYFHGINLIIMQDMNENAQRIEVASLSMINIITNVVSKSDLLKVNVCVGDLQLDNQMYDQGGFDFPVVLINQNPVVQRDMMFYLNGCLKTNIPKVIENSLLSVEIIWEIDTGKKACKEFCIKIAPISAYIEDTYITQLLEYATSMTPPCYVTSSETNKKTSLTPLAINVYIPDSVMIDAVILGKPLRLQSFIIEPISILLSVHTSVHLYVALDHSPLYFGTFEKKNLLTTPYRLGNALTMHYLSGAIFGAGWVVGSLEILGSPGGLAQALGSGLKDFISMPFQGLLQGPWGFIVGITHGSASLMKHVTAGTVNSVTKLASSVARNLDRLTLDDEHLQRQEESRRMRPQGVAQGLYQGLTGFGMSILAAVAGLAHHPLQQVWSGESTTKGLVTGVGLGLVGVVTKPLSGAAELVALTGQGLLQGAGWNSLPSPRQRPVLQYSVGCNTVSLRYVWRLMPLLANSRDSILHVTNADQVIHEGSNRAVTLVLTRQALLLVNIAEDSVEKIFPLKDLTGDGHPSESTMLRLYCPSTESQPARSMSPTNQNEMDLEIRARVAEFLRTSSTGLTSLSTNSDAQSDTQVFVPPHSGSNLLFYVNSDSRNYLLSVFNVAKKQNLGSGFTVL